MSQEASTGLTDRAAVTKLLAWGMVAIVSILAFVAWASGYGWHFGRLSSYQVFPLLGLLAFSIMWTHYVMVAVKRKWQIPEGALRDYFVWSGYIVLVCICLHPGLLVYRLFADGYGLPPHSYESYVAPGLGWVTLLGTASLLVFLAFEFHRFFGEKKWWHFVADASDLAMLAIAYHGLRLGANTQMGWYKIVWLMYTVTLLALLGYKYSTPAGTFVSRLRGGTKLQP